MKINVDILNGNLIENINNFEVVAITEIMDEDVLFTIDEQCHKNKIGFIYGLAMGLSFYCFVDYGNHEIINKNNKDVERYYIKNIIKGKKTKIILDDEQNVNFKLNMNDYIILKNIHLISSTKLLIEMNFLI